MTKKYLLVTLVAASVLAGGSVALAGPHGPGNCWNGGPAYMDNGPMDGPGWYHHREFRGSRHWGGGYGAQRWDGRGACWGYEQLTPERRAAFDKIMNESQPRLDELRMQFRVKRMEMDALSRNPNATGADIHNAAEDLNRLGTTINQERQAVQLRIEKEVGPLPCGGPHFNDGPRRGGGYYR